MKVDLRQVFASPLFWTLVVTAGSLFVFYAKTTDSNADVKAIKPRVEYLEKKQAVQDEVNENLKTFIADTKTNNLTMNAKLDTISRRMSNGR